MEFSSVKTVVTNLHFQICHYIPENSTGCSNRNEVPISFQINIPAKSYTDSVQLNFYFYFLDGMGLRHTRRNLVTES